MTDLFLSHMHWDHAGGIDLFPTARVWVQKDEYDYYTGDAWQSTHTHGGIDADDVLEIVKRNTEGKVSFVRGDDDTSLSGISFGIGGKHTFASQFVSCRHVRTPSSSPRTTCISTKTSTRTRRSRRRSTPVSNLRTQDRMKSLASEPRLLVPGHDPAVFARFPHVSDRIVRIE